jgi:hypothetical protein
VRATEHAPSGPCRVLEHRHGLAEIVRAESDGNDVIDLTKVKSEAPPPAEPSPSIAASRPKRAAARKK